MSRCADQLALIVILVLVAPACSGSGGDSGGEDRADGDPSSIQAELPAAETLDRSSGALGEAEAISRARSILEAEGGIGDLLSRPGVEIRSQLSDGFWQVSFSEGGQSANVIMDAATGAPAEIGNAGF